MARVGLCSRRAAEDWILDGRVSVNGSLLTSPAVDVGPDDLILVDGAPLPEAERTRLFLFHKPRGLVTSDHDPEGRPTVADFLRANWPDGPRTVTVGRLDINTEGLLLLTNDGGLARVLELPQTGWVRRYRVRVKGETDQARLDTLARGVTLDGIDYAGIEARLDRIQGSNCWLTMGLREGKNREIKRVLEHLGLEVNRLIRLSFGPFQLLDLAEGAVEEVRARVLRDQLGDALAAEAGVDFGETPPVRAADAPPTPRSAKPERPPRRERPDRSALRPGERPRGRPDSPTPTAPPPRLERPQAGTRKHVSALRRDATEPETARPRKRIERSETADRHARTVRVERVMDARGPQRTGAQGSGLQKTGARARRDAERPALRADRDARPNRASPSALGKRERIARSGGAPRPDGARNDRSRDGRPRNGRPRDDGKRNDRQRDERRPGDRRDRAERPERRDTERPRSPGGSGDRGPRASGRTGSKAPPRAPRPARGNGGAPEQKARRPDPKRSRPTDERRSERPAGPRGAPRSREAASPRGAPKRGSNRAPKAPPPRGPRGPAKPKR